MSRHCSTSSKPHSHEHSPEHSHGHQTCVVEQQTAAQGSTESEHSNCCATAALASPVFSGSQPLAATKVVAEGVSTPIRIMQMDCPTEEALIRKKLTGLKGVISMEFNLMQRVLTVVHQADALAAVLAAIKSLDFEPEVAADKGPLVAPQAQAKAWWPLLLAGIAAVAAEAVGWLGGAVWLGASLALVAVLLSGLTTYRKGWLALRHGDLNINALMSIAVTGAFLLGEWPEAATVMVLFTVAELIEAKSLERARNAVAGLMQLAPETATVQQASGEWVDVPASEVMLGCLVRVKPGEAISLDGEIVEGRSSINQAPITGESQLIDKQIGDLVFAGTLNAVGSFVYRVTAVADNTTLARIIHAVAEAQNSKAPTQRFVDRFARVYTPVVLLIALMVALLPPLFFGTGWLDWGYKALVLLVIACPCALVISTPVTIVSGLAAAARRGILIKGGVYLEQGYQLTYLALDKTGTLTQGKPKQTDFEKVSAKGEGDSVVYQCLAASLASRSDHPLSQAILRAQREEGERAAKSSAAEAAFALRQVKDFKAELGLGITGSIDGVRYALGNPRFIESLVACAPALTERLQRLENTGKSLVILADEQQPLALFAVSDTLKTSSQQAIAELHALGIKTVMLTGDNQATADVIAAQAGIDQVKGGLMPADKLAAIKALQQQGCVGMVGDGINDAPALAQAQIGFAMGAMGTDTAIETADVALMDDDLRKVATFVRLSRKTRNLLWQNIALALGIKGVVLGLTLMGVGTMWMAVFADMGASLLVVANGLRLLQRQL